MLNKRVSMYSMLVMCSNGQKTLYYMIDISSLLEIWRIICDTDTFDVR